MRKALVVLFLALVSIAAYFVFFERQDAQSVFAENGVEENAFLSGELVKIGLPLGISVEKFERMKNCFLELSQKAGAKEEKDYFAGLSSLSSYYAKKQAINAQSVFFQNETNIDRLCTQQETARKIVDEQEQVYVLSAELLADSLEFSSKYSKPLFSLDPSKEAGTLEELKAELEALELACVVK